MGRPRKKAHRNWPDGLLARPRENATYYYFRDKKTGKEIALGKDLKAAIQGVKFAQVRRAVDPVQAVISAIEQPVSTVDQHFTWFLTNRSAKKKLAEGSRYSLETRIEKLRRLLGPHQSISKVTAGIINSALDGVSEGDRNRYRSLAIEIFRSAVARSLIEINPAEQTERAVAKPEKLRERLSAKQYASVLALADPWMRRAMELQRLSLARPSDLCRLLRTDWDSTKKELRLVVGKTGAKLLVQPHKTLAAALDVAFDNQERQCPFLLARPYNRRPLGTRTHVSELNEQMLRDEFERLRDQAGIEAQDGKRAPTFYEIKSRGVDDYVALGWPMPRIQSLIGHETEAMTEHYSEGHGERWKTVDLSRIK